MPFADELRPVEVVPWRAEWPAEFWALAARLAPSLAGIATCIDHIGSTSVPGLAAKDVIDAQVRVEQLDDAIPSAFESLGLLYGQIKQPAWLALMVGADAWATLRGWPPPQGDYELSHRPISQRRQFRR